jgi:hypothetical protein
MNTGEKISGQEALNKLVKSIDFLNSKGQSKAIKRGKVIIYIFEELGEFKNDVLELEDLARQEFRASIQKYLLGFYEDSIHHSCASVEMGLLIRLEEKLTDKEKEKIHEEINRKKGKPLALTFGEIFNMAKGKEVGIICEKKLAKKIEVLISRRNTYVHVSNVLSGIIISLKKLALPEIINMLDSMPNVNKVGKFILSKYDDFLIERQRMLSEIPDLAWCTKDNQREFIQNAVEENWNELLKMAGFCKKGQLSNFERIKMALKLRRTISALKEEIFLKKGNLDVLQISYEILKEIKIF